MSIFEVQIKAASFLQAQRRSLQTMRICPPAPVSFAGRTLQIQRILFGNNSLRHHEQATFGVFYHNGGPDPVPTPNPATGFELQIAQDVVLQVADSADIVTTPNGAATGTDLHLTAVLALDYYPGPTGGCYLSTRLRRVEWGALPPLPPGVDPAAVQQYVTDVLSKTLPFKATQFNFSTMIPGAPSQVENAGVSADQQLQRVVFRVAPGGANSGSDARWTNFYRGAIPDRLGNAQWAYFVDAGMLETIHADTAQSAIRGKLPSEIRLINVGATYWQTNGNPRVTTTAYANVDLPDPLGVKYVEISTLTEYSVGTPNNLVADIHLPDEKKLIEQNFAGARAALRMFGGWGLVLSDLLVGIAVDAMGGLPLPVTPGCAEVTPLHRRCTNPVGFSGLGTNAIFNAIAADNDGMALTGNLGVVPYTMSELEVEITNFRWVPPRISCGQWSDSMLDDFRANARDRASLLAGISLSASGTAPIYVCGWQVINDPLGVFSQPGSVTVDRGQLPATISIRIRNPGAAYDAGTRYPCDLLLTTTAGVRLVRIPPPPLLTQEDVNRMADLMLAMLATCNIAKTSLKDWDKIHPAWLDDPYPGELNQKYWEIEVTGLDAGRTVLLVDAVGEQVITARAVADTPVRLSILQSGLSGELSLQLDGGGLMLDAAQADQPTLSGLDFRQQTAWTAATMALEGLCRHVLRASTVPDADVLAVLDGGVVAFSLANPFSPIRLSSWGVDGLNGACIVRGQLVAFGVDGFAMLNPDQRPLLACASGLPVLDVVSSGDVLYALTAEALEVRSARLCLVARIEVEGGRCLSLSGRRLLIGGRDGVTGYDTSEPYRPRRDTAGGDLDIVGLVTPPAAPAGSTVALLADGSAALLRVGPNRVEQIGTYRRAPWFADAVRLRNRLVQIAPDRRSLVVSALDDARLVVPFAMREG
jgi:hypothetical protein